MGRSWLIVFVLSLVLSCINDINNKGSGNTSKKEVMDLAVKYASEKFKEAKISIAPDGIITVTEGQIILVTPAENRLKYIVDPAEITRGLIDDDSDEDAIITLYSLKGQYFETPEHLILIKYVGKLMLNRVIESDMKILNIKNRVITAEVFSHSLNNPLHDCAECKEIVKYRFQTGDLIRFE